MTVANGKVYVATFSRHLSVYGLRAYTPAPVRNNLVLNPGFENGTASWTSITPGRFYVQPNYAYYGKSSGVLCAALQTGYEPDICPKQDLLNTPAPAELSQSVIAPNTASYRLSARCTTNILSKNHWITPGSVLLEVYVDGRAAGAQTIPANAGYQTYTIDFQAAQGQSIEIRYWAPAVTISGSVQRSLIPPEAWAVIDEVSLTEVTHDGSDAR